MIGMWIRRLLIVALLAVLAWQWLRPHASISAPATTSENAPATHAPSANDAAPSTSGNHDHLPPEALTTLRLIAGNGPFPYDRDGVVFGNYEHRLPEQPRGYYHEYTVPTPGEHSRGARRIITGGEPPQSYYYTDDHYQSFRQVEAQP
jgi:guanyl-specific ribonuclease Sa